MYAILESTQIKAKYSNGMCCEVTDSDDDELAIDEVFGAFHSSYCTP